MLSVLRNWPTRVMKPRPAQVATFGLDFRNAIPLVTGFNLIVTPSNLQLELLGESGEIAGSAILPRPEIEDLT